MPLIIKQLLKDFNLLIQANDRIGITGKTVQANPRY